MTFHNQCDIILSALNIHFGKHRIKYMILHDHLMQNNVEADREDLLLEYLKSKGLIKQLLATGINEYQISPEGEEFINNGGFEGREKKENVVYGNSNKAVWQNWLIIALTIFTLVATVFGLFKHP